LPPEILEHDLQAYRDARIEDLRRKFRSAEYYVPASEISAALVEKHLKR
jgi:hypothetical protein